MAQEELQKQGSTLLRTAPKEPRKYNVIILNDDFTTFEFVIMVVMTVFGKTEAEACNIAETTHVHQKATVGSYTLDTILNLGLNEEVVKTMAANYGNER